MADFDAVERELREALAWASETQRNVTLTRNQTEALLAELDRLRKENERLQEPGVLVSHRRFAEMEAELAKALRERDEWADAIRSVAPGRVASAYAAKHAIAELKGLLDKVNATSLAQSAELARLRPVVEAARDIANELRLVENHQPGSLTRTEERLIKEFCALEASEKHG